MFRTKQEKEAILDLGRELLRLKEITEEQFQKTYVSLFISKS